MSLNRKTGIDAAGDVPWGTHLCQFYETKKDLVDILLPYFKAGLENNEFCMCLTSDPLDEKKAEEALRKAVPDFDQYLERGQIEILAHAKWYLKNGVFDLQRVLRDWSDKLDRALAEGYDGMRVSGDVAWLEEKDWTTFASYEEQMSNVIGEHPVLAICAYPLSKCGASEIIDVVATHCLTLIRRGSNWVLQKQRESKKLASPVTSKWHQTPLQERFIRTGFEGFTDEETIELLLSLVLTEQECKKQARECIEQFKNPRGFLAASRLELEQAGISSLSMFCIKLLNELPVQILKEKIIEQPVYGSSREIFDYLQYAMRDLKKEVFKVIYLNNRNQINRNQIIDTADLFEGTLDSIPIRPREIVESAIAHNATGLIFAHNHPAGDPKPSKSDKQLTRDLVFIGMILQIKVLDHIIIGGNTYFSFADEGLIGKYEDDFLNLRIRGVFGRGAGQPQQSLSCHTSRYKNRC